MKILLTGGSGMVGSNIRESDFMEKSNLLFPDRTELDLFSYQNIKSYLKSNLPDLVIHAAGHVGGIQSNMKNKEVYLTRNLEMGFNLMNACLEVGVPRVLNLGSSCMYPKGMSEPIPESKILGGELESTNEGYAIAKIAVAKLCEYISLEHQGFSYKTIIPCNLYGRYDKFDPAHSHLIPAVIVKIHEAVISQKKTVEIWGDGTARREFMYAGDLVRCMFGLVEKFSEMPYYLNVGLGFDYSIKEYYQAISQEIGFTGDFSYNLDRPVGMQRKLVDITELMKLKVRFDSGLSSGIRKTYEYYKSKTH